LDSLEGLDRQFLTAELLFILCWLRWDLDFNFARNFNILILCVCTLAAAVSAWVFCITWRSV